MLKIVISIPTYKRPTALEKLVKTILETNLDACAIEKIHLLIVDNDIEKTAEPTSKKFEGLNGIFDVVYINYPIKGLSNVRNEILVQALNYNPEFIVSVDDDEYVASNWLNELVTGIIENGADIAMGPVVSTFTSAVLPSISRYFQAYDIKNNQQIHFFESNNFIISTKFLERTKLRFDERFNFTGGEDSFFGISAIKRGAKIVWIKQAVVYETVPDKRANLKWLIKRKFRTSNQFTRILLIEKSYPLVLYKIAKSIFYIFAGILLLVLCLFPVKRKYIGIIKLSEAVGGLTALGNIRYNEYQ